jgi:hypothetical protein
MKHDLIIHGTIVRPNQEHPGHWGIIDYHEGKMQPRYTGTLPEIRELLGKMHAKPTTDND